MQVTLRTKLSLSYITVALLLVALITLMTNVFLERQFRDYIIKEQEARNLDIVDLVSQQYDAGENVWRNEVIENIGINALEQGLIIKVSDADGNTLWDATIHNNGLCVQMINHMSENMISRYPDFNGSYTVRDYPITKDAAVVGNVAIGYFGPFFFNDNDLAFINTLNRLLGIVAVFSLLLALITGALTAKRLSTPIAKAVAAAREIGKGHYDSRIDDLSNTTEIDALTATINDLAEGLGRQEKLRRRLTADVAHELRTPLATLQSSLEAMIDGIWEADKLRLNSCHEEILRINRMVGDLEKLTRYESENLILNKESFDLSELVQHLMKSFESEFLGKKVALHFHGEACPILADSDKISQVVVNLLSNALKYTPSGGKVEIAVTHNQNQGVVTVRDNGMGISPEDLPHIFERFYRADKSRSRGTGGAGVGLAIVKTIIDAHRGEIQAASVLNEGTEFVISLPAMRDRDHRKTNY